MKACDIMTAQPATVSSHDPVSAAAEIMRSRSIGMVPVVDVIGSRKLCGVITDRDIAVRCVAARHPSSCAVGDHMTPQPLVTVKPGDDISVVLETMERSHVRRVPVVDDAGLLAGIIAQADLALKVGHDDPAKVGHLLESVSMPMVAT